MAIPPTDALNGPSPKPLQQWERRFLVGLLMLLLLTFLPWLPRVPRAFVDDSWSQPMAAYTLAFEGRPRNPGLLNCGGIDRHFIEPRLFPSLFGALVYRAAGFGFVQGRVAPVGFTVFFVFVVYAVMRRLFGPLTAAGAAVMTAIDPWVFVCGRSYREEIFLAAMLWLSWWLLLGAVERRSTARAFLGGLCTGLACWTHPNAVVFSAAALIAWLASIARANVKESPHGAEVPGSRLPAAVLGFAVGLAPYVLYVAYVQYTSDVRLMDQVGRRMGAFARPVGTILAAEAARWVNFLRLPERIPLLLLVLWAVIRAALRGNRGDRLLVVLILLSAILLPLWQPVSTGRYFVVLVPAFAALVWRSLPEWGLIGRAASHTDEAHSRRRLRRGVGWFALAVYAAMSLFPTVAILHAHRHADYVRWSGRIAEHVPRDARVIAPTILWTALHDRQFLSSIAPGYKDWQTVEEAVAFIQLHRPEYLVQMSTPLHSVGGISPRPADLQATPFGRACEAVAAKVPSEILTEFYDPDFGATRVWKLHWHN